MADKPGISWFHAARWVLCAAVFLHAAGFAVAVFTRTGTAWGGIADIAPASANTAPERLPTKQV